MITATAWAPGRVNIIGEHTDYTGGFVFPMAIDFGVTATVTKRTDQIISMKSNLMTNVVDIALKDLKPGAISGWAAYVAGSVWSINRSFPIPIGLDIELESDLPLGAGMSSSAAVECSVILAVVELFELSVPKRELARWAKDAENLFVGVPTGAMDQVASFFGKRNHALFFDTRDDLIEEVPINLAAKNSVFAVIDTKTKHALIDGGYAARRADCETASNELNVAYLRDVSDLETAVKLLESKSIDSRVIKRLKHVVSENSRVLAAVTALKNNDLFRLGALMNASHVSLRDDFEVSCPELDTAVKVAQDIGAYGARMMGGGFGGSAIVLIEKNLMPILINEVTRKFSELGYPTPMIYKVTASEGAHVVNAAK